MANIKSSNANPKTSNFVSYSLIEMMTWQGLGDLVNRFRVKSLGLEPLSSFSATGMLTRLKIPVTYCWSPALIPKPPDWGPFISVTGFCFLGLASSYTPDAELAQFLAAGPPPIYIGFGSIVVDDPDGMTRLIFEAVAKTGQRALVSKGWGGLGASIAVPSNIFLIGNCPHDWLFQRVSCVVHHGGAGTTAAGLALDKPTVVVPFFGDQPFWGSMIKRAGAGPAPIPHKQLTADRLAEAILEALTPGVVERARELGNAVRNENGAKAAAQSFQEQLDIDLFRCNLFPSAKAVWKVKKSRTRLSALAATVLGNAGLLNMNDLRPYVTGPM
jgi:UDP:flavonoid glycosyltransferase YjiC (YdhE family)